MQQPATTVAVDTAQAGPSAPRGRGGFKPRGRGAFKSRGSKYTKPAPIEKPGVISSDPKMDTSMSLTPTKLSTQSSELRNDPMWQDFESDGLSGFIPHTPRKTFAVTFEGLDGIIDETSTRIQHALNFQRI